MFAWARDGISFQKIADRCTTANYPAPGRRVGVEAWNSRNVGLILHNPIYKGRLEWGRTRQAKHPVTGKSIGKPVPEEEWTVEYWPELEIVSSELWDQAQATIATHHGFGLAKLGGMAKRSGEVVPLLIGLLACGICGDSIIATGYTTKSGRLLGCKKHRFKKQCPNAHSLHELALEDAVIQKVIQEVLSTTSVNQTLSEFHSLLGKEIESQIQEAKRKQGGSQSTCGQVRLVETSIQNIIASLRDYGPSKSLLDELARLERRKTLLQSQKNDSASVLVMPSFEEVRKFFMAELQNLPSILGSDRLATREAFRRHLDRLILIPEFENGVPVYRIKGAFRPLGPSTSVMPSAKLPLDLRHYKEITMTFELIVPAVNVKKNYLSHPSCSSEAVKSLIIEGLTISQIASKLSTTTYIVKRVVHALDLRSGEVNYLSHPKCSTQTLIEGRKLGKTHSAIASELGISRCVVMAVQRALVASGVNVPRIDKPHSPNKNIDYLNYPKCPAADVLKSRLSGRTMAEIASEFGASAKIISGILHAVQSSTGSRLHTR